MESGADTSQNQIIAEFAAGFDTNFGADSQKQLPETLRQHANAVITRKQTIVAIKRAMGTAIDLLAIGSVAIAPVIYYSLLHNLDVNSVFAALLSDNRIFVYTCVAVSPLPLIYLRLVFRSFLRFPTPGEMFCGISTITLHDGPTGIVQEIIYSLAQYFNLAFASIFGTLIVCVLACSGCLRDGSIEGMLALAAVPAASLILSAIAYWPATTEDNRSFVDQFANVFVTQLRK